MTNPLTPKRTAPTPRQRQAEAILEAAKFARSIYLGNIGYAIRADFTSPAEYGRLMMHVGILDRSIRKTKARMKGLGQR